MERADTCRRAARDAVSDVEPPQLRDRLTDVLDGTSMAPGVFAIESARQLDPDVESDAVASQAAGVQLIYDGLRLTRRLAREAPWEAAVEPHTPGENAPPLEDATDADLEILAADILVARGFYLLARTDAAGKAVRTVQAFGQEETHVQEGEGGGHDGVLERDVLELAALAGAAAVGRTPTPELLATARAIADATDQTFPPEAEQLPFVEYAPTEPPADDGLATDRATSATDT
ncbi:hypothetical protein OB905_08970 [Halobacteria archaeon AArc-dxtr1]|nr:hypothetical protein [Halobacteria archaeon AArc-dxtr1]